MNKPQKIQLRLTIHSAAFFIIIAGLIYFFFNNKFEEEVLDKFQFKSEIMSRFLKTNPQFFTKDNVKDKTQLIQLIMLNNVSYLVIEDNHGSVIDAINLDVAEYYQYVTANNFNNISFDETIYRVVLPVKIIENKTDKIYLELKAGMVTAELKERKSVTALLSLSILLAGIIFSYFQYRFIRLFLPN